MDRQLVILKLGREHFGVDISAVESIIKAQEITSVPQSLDFVEGITNLRGAVLPVIDLRKRFGIQIQEESNDTRIVVINNGQSKIGMVVDGVSEVLTIGEEIIEPTPAVVSSLDTTFITGIAKLEDRLIILLDLDKTLSSEEKEVLHTV